MGFLGAKPLSPRRENGVLGKAPKPSERKTIMRKIIFYEKDKLQNTLKSGKSPYFSLKTQVRRKGPFLEVPIGRKTGREIFKEWKI